MVGLLSSIPVFPPDMAAFQQGLMEVGYIAGKNMAFEYRSADGQYDRLPTLASDLIRLPSAVIVAANGAVVTKAAYGATKTIPIVFIYGGDPVKDELVSSLNRPGGNVTGITFFSNVLAAKRLELLRELTSKASLIAVLVNPRNASAEADLHETELAAHTLGMHLVVLRASTEAKSMPHSQSSLDNTPTHCS